MSTGPQYLHIKQVELLGPVMWKFTEPTISLALLAIRVILRVIHFKVYKCLSGRDWKVWGNADLNLVKRVCSDCLSRLASVLINAIFPPSGILSIIACAIKMSLIVTFSPETNLDNSLSWPLPLWLNSTWSLIHLLCHECWKRGCPQISYQCQKECLRRGGGFA